MRIDVLTLFPGICAGAFGESILARAAQKNLVTFRAINIRDYATDKHRTTDDTPYGGGQGMVMKVEPIDRAVDALRTPSSRVILLSPSGPRFNQATAQRLATYDHLILISGHYEGVDQRVADYVADEELSIGDYVLTNGTIAAVVVADAVARLVPGVLGDENSASDESFSNGYLEHPQYTRPAEYKGWRVPEILLGGHHAEILAWRRARGLEKTACIRPDLLERPGPRAAD